MKWIITAIFCCIFAKTYSQVTIVGPILVQPGEIATYDAYFPGPLNPYTLIYWSVSGGTIASMSTDPNNNPVTITIQWDNVPTTGNLEIYEDLGGQNGGLLVQVGTPNVSPAIQSLNYGATPNPLCVNLIPGITNVTFQWEYSPDGANWTPITNATNQCYLPPAPLSMDYYRCLSTIDGILYISDPAIVEISPLDPGSITLVQQPTFNALLNITATAASGGYCLSSSYQYQWEISVEGGPWTTVGNTAAYPSNAPPIVGNTLVRRKITCGTQTTYSNTLDIKVSYTSVDYENRNYIRTYTVATKGINSWQQADQLEVGKKFQETNYFDGLGRSIQGVNKGISSTSTGTWVDMVSLSKYDKLGRSTLSYLPYPTANEPGKFKTSTTDQVTFYSTNFNESSPWGTAILENSPLNRVKKSIDVGSHRITNNIGVELEYDFNNANGGDEKVHVWRIGFTAGSLPTTSATDIYQNGTLLKGVTKDENGKQVIEYKDVQGNTVLKKVQLKESGAGLTNEHAGWLCTYYVFDAFNRLRYVITPRAVAYLDANNWVLSQAIADELCFYYEYDAKGRTITQKKPGSAKTSMVYDQRDRLVFTQDGNQAAKSPQEWQVNTYDELDRITMTGIYKSNKTAGQLQTEINNASQSPSIVVPGPGQEHLILSHRSGVLPQNLYMATISVTLLPGFASLSASDEYAIRIGPVAIAQTAGVIQDPIDQAEIDNPAIFTAMAYYYYDQYDFPGVKSFDNTFTNLQAYGATEPDVEPIQKSNRTKSMTTGSKVRVLGTANFLLTTLYYDENGALIQTRGDNYKSSEDIATTQYHFDGRVMSISAWHGNTGNSFNGFVTLTKNEYDKIGRLKTLRKKFGTADFIKISEYSYDELGRVKNKKIGRKAGNPNDPLETLDYSYDVTGALTGINKDYALSTSNLAQWDRYFGLYLGYENFDNRFAAGRFDRLITGLIWKTQGDNTPRMYDFTYDNANRLINANFKQKSKPSETSWSNAKVDFSENNILYDENGNIKQLYRKGIQPGNNSALYIDKLSYTYEQVAGGEWSNQLLKVFDNSPDIGPAANGKLGDFKDETYNVDANDYTYDANGNLVIDNNKKIRNAGGNGITYNFLNKPEKIVLENKSTVEYTYDAAGIKLAKKVTPFNGTAKITYYIGEFVYEGDELQYILHEEGRLRVMTPVNRSSPLGASGIETRGNIQLAGGKWGVFEYFIKDHLGSTRMVLTEEYHKEVYKATMEDNPASEEERLFGKVDANGNPDANNEVIQTRQSNSSIWASNATAKISKLLTIGTSSAKSIGPNMLLKVMSGDYLSATAEYYYDVPSGNVSSHNILSPLVNSLLGGLSAGGVAPVIKDGAASLQTILQNATTSPLLSFFDSRPTAAANRPKAYLNILFFDENFNVVQDAGQAAIVNPNNNDYFVVLPNVKAPQNGYVYIYLSNESETPVYFDDFTVSHERGVIVEESHYYPYGLKIASISSRAFSKLPNRYGFQGDFSEQDEETGWDGFELRDYDPQIGRWIQQDPYDQFASGYLGMGNDPVNMLDPNGGASMYTSLAVLLFNFASRIVFDQIPFAGRASNSWPNIGLSTLIQDDFAATEQETIKKIKAGDFSGALKHLSLKIPAFKDWADWSDIAEINGNNHGTGTLFEVKRYEKGENKAALSINSVELSKYDGTRKGYTIAGLAFDLYHEFYHVRIIANKEKQPGGKLEKGNVNPQEEFMGHYHAAKANLPKDNYVMYNYYYKRSISAVNYFLNYAEDPVSYINDKENMSKIKELLKRVTPEFQNKAIEEIKNRANVTIKL